LAQARSLAALVAERFAADDGGLYDSTAPDLVYRTRETADGPTPSGAAAAAHAFARLAQMTGDATDRERAARVLATLSPAVADSPADHPWGAVAVDLLVGPVARVELRGPVAAARRWAAAIRARSFPFAMLVRPAAATEDEPLQATVCVDATCLEPATTLDDLLARLSTALRTPGPTSAPASRPADGR
ncbi:MAG TPA: hypothetical protein VEI02_11620, partial [Planctomycetota bacterium]|nr:hypothetical protein [Planctomycetota bacterium]